MSANDDPATGRLEREHRSKVEKGPASLPVTVVASLLSAVLAGGGGSYLTGSNMAQTMREGQIKLEAQVTSLRDDVRRIGDDQRAALSRIETRNEALEERLRLVEREVWSGRPPTPR